MKISVDASVLVNEKQDENHDKSTLPNDGVPMIPETTPRRRDKRPSRT